MRCTRVTLKLLGLLCASSMCLGATFIWTVGGDDDSWQTCENWSINGLICCYPCTTGDDVIIPFLVGGYAVELSEEDIGGFSILGSVTFSSPSGTPALTVESLSISAASAETVITISDATISVE